MHRRCSTAMPSSDQSPIGLYACDAVTSTEWPHTHTHTHSVRGNTRLFLVAELLHTRHHRVSGSAPEQIVNVRESRANCFVLVIFFFPRIFPKQYLLNVYEISLAKLFNMQETRVFYLFTYRTHYVNKSWRMIWVINEEDFRK